jgi:hypothetical protein
MKCPSVHYHSKIEELYDSLDNKEKKQLEKLKRYLESDTGHTVGEKLKHELNPFKSFSRGHINIRCLFVICKDCNGEVLDRRKCKFCNNSEHSMNDAVLFFISSHDKAYKKGKKIIKDLKK